MTPVQKFDLGLVDNVVAASIGKPGQRTFKVTAESGRGRAIVWMEKEQLFQVALAIRQFAVATDRPSAPVRFEPDLPPPRERTELEFKAVEMSIRHNQSTDMFTIEAANVDPDAGPEAEAEDEEDPVAVQFSFSRPSGVKLSEEAIEVCAAGRPRCPLCGGPIDPEGHVCPKKNGHHKGEIKFA
ncbi:MAG: DUF3090 family protein [Chloroflexi bacterium]|nr:DUF3090 family protein [Chloroflexota bacterium]